MTLRVNSTTMALTRYGLFLFILVIHTMETTQIPDNLKVATPLVERLANGPSDAINTPSYSQLWWDEVTQPFQNALEIDNGALNLDNLGVAGYLGVGIPHAFVKGYLLGCATGCFYACCCNSGQAMNKQFCKRLSMVGGIPCIAGPAIGAYIAIDQHSCLPFLLGSVYGCGSFPGCAAGVATGTSCVGCVKQLMAKEQPGYEALNSHATQTGHSQREYGTQTALRKANSNSFKMIDSKTQQV